MKLHCVLVAAAASALPTIASAATFSETFDDGNASSRWTTVSTNAGADTGSDFAFNYSSLVGPNGASIGVPRAGQTTTTGLQLWANRSSPTGVEGINAYANGLNLSGPHVMEFDIYAHWTNDATSTNYAVYGFYHSTQTGTWNSLGTPATSGYWFTTSGDGGSSTDYRAHEAGGNIGTAANYYGGTQDSAVTTNTPNWQTLFPDLDGAGARSVAGTIANRWVTMRITRDGGSILWEIKNSSDANFVTAFSFTDSTETNPNGTITVGMTDPFASISPLDTFFIYDNISVTPVPEPASLALLGLGGLALVRRRRQ